MLNNIGNVPQSTLQDDEQTQGIGANNFGLVFLNHPIKNNQNLNPQGSENDFNQLLNVHNTENSKNSKQTNKNHIINHFNGQEGSIQFGQNQQEIKSDQYSGFIPQDGDYNEYSDNIDKNVSHFNCQKSNQLSQNMNNFNDNYGEFSIMQNPIVQSAHDIDKVEQESDLEIHSRYYRNILCPHLLPIPIKQNIGFIDSQMFNNLWNNDERISAVIEQGEKYSSDEDEESVTQNINQVDEENDIEDLEDAVSEEFKLKIANFIDQNQNSKISLTQTIYGNKQKSIKIIELKDYENQIQRLCQQFSNLKYSEIALSFQLIINFENCQKFLQTIKPKQQKLIIREINQLILDEQKANENENKDELRKTRIKIEEFKQVNNIQNIQDQSLYQTAIKIIEQRNLKFDIKKCDKETKKQKKKDFESNRNKLIEINNQKANIIKQYQMLKINEQQCNQQLQQIKAKKKDLEKIGKELFLDLMNIENGFCRIDFHKFFSAEIENLLDGVFEKIESYKLRHEQKQIKLQIIVGKGLHSKDQKPIIGPMTKQYIQQYLQQQVEIIEGKIDVII